MAVMTEAQHVEDGGLRSVGKEGDNVGTSVLGLDGETQFTEQEANRIRWKLDLILLPIVS